MTPPSPPPRTRPALCLSLISSVISEAEWMWSLNDLQIDSTLRLCLSPSMSSNCTLCEGVAFIGFSQHLILISMSDQSPLLSHFFLIGFRELRGWRSSDDYLDFSKRLSWGGGLGGLGTVHWNSSEVPISDKILCLHSWGLGGSHSGWPSEVLI